MEKIEIIFKSGAVKYFEAEEIKVFKNGFDQLVKIEWTGSKGNWPRHLVMEEVAAIFSTKGDE